MEEETVLDETLIIPEEQENSINDSDKVLDIDVLSKKAELYESQKIRAEKAEREAKILKQQLSQKTSKGLDVSDYIDISASLDGLDQTEKEYLAEQHKLSGKSLGEIRNDKNFSYWQKSYREEVEKERLTLTPSSTQSESDRPKSLTERLSTASLADKEQILREAGLYKDPKRRSDSVNIGQKFIK